MARPENLIRHNCTCTRFLWEMVNSKVARLSAINLPFDINRYAWINFVSSTIYFIFSIHKVRLLTRDNSLIRLLRNACVVCVWSCDEIRIFWSRFVCVLILQFFLTLFFNFLKLYLNSGKNWNDNNWWYIEEYKYE